MLLLVALVLAAATTVVVDPGIGRAVLDGIRRALCEVSGLGCSADSARQPCVVKSRGDRDSASVTVALVRVGANAAVLREVRSDGTVAVTLLEGGSAGAEIGLGAGLDLGRSLALGGELRAAAIAGLGGGRTWIVPDAAAADRLIKDLGQRRRPIVDGPLGLVRDAFGDGPEVREPDIVFTEGSTGKDGSASWRRGGQRASIDRDLGEAVGMRTDRRTGLRTAYVRVDRATSAALSSRLLGSGAGGSSSSLALGVTLDRAGEPVELSLTGSQAVSGVAGLPAPLRRLVATNQLDGGGRIEIDARLDLRDPGNREAALRFLDGVRRPDRVAELVGAAGGLGDRLLSFSDLQARAYRVNERRSSAGGRVKAGGGVGGGLSRQREDSRLAGAWERPPGGAWRERLDCVFATAA
ncbi:MAG: hypothetical protein ACR2ML_05810 [Solirubrobacteraceae bacterium]